MRMIREADKNIVKMLDEAGRKSNGLTLVSAATGGTDALVKGEDVAQGIAKGTASGALNAMVDTGGEMVGALKDGSSLGSLGKDLASSASDVTGDFVKNAGSEAIEDSFNKTFEELNKKK